MWRLAVMSAALSGCVARPTAAPQPSSRPAQAAAIAPEPPASLPTATVRPPPCAIAKLQKLYVGGEWKSGELLAQECLRSNPLETEARLVLVRIYLMRAYAAHESRWLDEARRQLHMAEGDPQHAREAHDLLELVDTPTIE